MAKLESWSTNLSDRRKLMKLKGKVYNGHKPTNTLRFDCRTNKSCILKGEGIKFGIWEMLGKSEIYVA